MTQVKGIVDDLLHIVASLMNENGRMRKMMLESEVLMRAHICVTAGEDNDLYWSNAHTYTADSPRLEASSHQPAREDIIEDVASHG